MKGRRKNGAPGGDVQRQTTRGTGSAGKTTRTAKRYGASAPPAQASRNPVQRKAELAVGFSDVRNDVYGEDFLGQELHADGNLATFREQTGSMGPEALGVNQQANPDGTIQPQFTAGIKRAMATATKIRSNLAGFSQEQITHARLHSPQLTGEEIGLLRNNHPDFGQVMVGGAIVDREITGQDGNEWFSMKDLLVDKDDATQGPHPRAWSPALAAISVWELSILLHNEAMFEKTEFHYFVDQAANLGPLPPDYLEQFGVALADADDLMTVDALGVAPPESGFARALTAFKSLW